MMEECEKCYGTGKLVVGHQTLGNGQLVLIQLPKARCPECNGSGQQIAKDYPERDEEDQE